MKKILAIVKTNLLSVICIAVTIISLPVLIILSTGKSSKIHTEVQSELDGMNRSLQQVQYQYQFEPVTPGVAAIQISRTPTKSMNDAMKAWGEQLRTQAAESIEVIVDRNARAKSLLVEGILPEPEESRRVSKLQEVVGVWPSAHNALIASVGAGSPPDRATLEAELNIAWRQRIERIQSTLGSEVSEEELEKIRLSLRDQRLAKYRAAASELRFYVDDGAFIGVQRWSQNTLPPLETVWEWQWLHWIHGDLLRALEAANTEGQWARSLLEGPVKRLETISVSPRQYSGESNPAPISFAAEVAPNWSASETGRSAWPGAEQGLYDLRYATVTALIDGSRLLDVIEAFAATNLMRVVQVELTDVDPAPDLYQGYVYGQGRLVRASFVVETVWLRSWTTRYMPPAVRRALGVPEDPATANPDDPNAGSDDRG
jgi:hypothetical protein